jgi:DNA-binding NtrC family response regulator
MPDAPTRVLIIDDDPGVLQILRDYFDIKGGYAVDTAATAEDGLAAARRSRPSLVLIDFEMPGIGGVEGLKQLRRTIGTIPVLMVSGTTNLTAASDAMKHGALAFIPKPFNFQYIDHLVALALAQNG